MTLPQDWQGVDWKPSVIILPNTTEGLPTNVINSQHYPQYPRGYFMMAYIDSQGRQAVGYNAADVGGAGQFVSEFVFWHEIGHHALGHTGGLQHGQMTGITYTNNKELDADQHACAHWLDRNDLHGLQVVMAVIDYFANQGNVPGDAEHPPPAIRGQRLRQLVQGRQFRSFTIHNDDHTSPEFVKDVLCQVFGYSVFDSNLDNLVREIEQKGSKTFLAKANGRLIERNEADKIMHFVRVKMRFAGHPHFNMTCDQLP